jgi:hypothetical protein
MGPAWFYFTKFIAPKVLAIAQEKIATLGRSMWAARIEDGNKPPADWR